MAAEAIALLKEFYSTGNPKGAQPCLSCMASGFHEAASLLQLARSDVYEHLHPCIAFILYIACASRLL